MIEAFIRIPLYNTNAAKETSTMHTEDTNADVVRALLANDAAARNKQNTLNTARAANGNTVLLSYDWARVAEVTPEGDVIVYEGHEGRHSTTTDDHVNLVRDVVEEDRLDPVSLAPQDGTIPPTFKYAGNYVGGFENMSPVEQNAFEEVRTTMRRRLKSR